MTHAFRIITAGLLLLLTGSEATADSATGVATATTGSTTSDTLRRAVREFQQAEYVRAVELLSSLQPSPQRDYYSGLSELKLGNSKRAVEYLQQVTVDQPSNADAFYALAAAHFRRLEEVSVLDLGILVEEELNGCPVVQNHPRVVACLPGRLAAEIQSRCVSRRE